MTIWYIKPDTGTDSNASAGNGDSAGTARKKLDNIVAAALTPGDSIRYAESPAAASLAVNGTWTSRYLSASINISSSTNASPIVITTTAAHNLVNGDTVIVANHNTNTNANGVWTVAGKTSNTFQLTNPDGTNSTGNGVGGTSGTVTDITRSVVTLASAVTKNIACYGGRGALVNWTASANVTCSLNTTSFKEGGQSQSIAVATGFTTGLAAYFPLGAIVDFSTYQKVCFWVMQTAGTLVTSGQLQIQLCSDNAGATPVNTINFDVAALNTWEPITVDTGAALGASIQSVRVNVVTDVGAQTILVSNIFATNALTLDVGIGKSSGNYLHAQSINDTRIILDGPTSSTPIVTEFSMGYHGVSSTETVYLQSMFKYTKAPSISTQLQALQDTGSTGNPITISGGWDAASMASQTGKTWFDGSNGKGYGLVISSRTNITMSDKTLSFCRYYRGISIATNTDCNIQAWALNHNDSVGFNAGVEKDCTLGAEYCENNNYGFRFGNLASWVFANCNGSFVTNCNPSDRSKITVTKCESAFSNGNIYVNTVSDVRIFAGSLKGGKIAGLELTNSYGIHVYGAAFSNNVVADIKLTTMEQDNGCALYNCSFAVAPVVSGPAAGYSTEGGISIVQVNGDTTNHQWYTPSGYIHSEAGSNGYNTLTPRAYRIYLTTSNTYVRASMPMLFKLATINLKAGTNEISVSASRSNTGLEAGIMIFGGQAAGIASDVTDSITTAADTLDTLVLSVSPTVDCEVEVHAWLYNGTTYSMFVDNLKVKRGSFTGNIVETMAISDWVIRAMNAVTNTLAGYVESSGSSYTINVDTDEDCWLHIGPKIHARWRPGRVNALNEYAVATDIDATPYLFKCTTAGTSHATTEPTWNTTVGNTTSDGTAVWTCVSALPSPTTLLIGPKKPTVL